MGFLGLLQRFFWSWDFTRDTFFFLSPFWRLPIWDGPRAWSSFPSCSLNNVRMCFLFCLQSCKVCNKTFANVYRLQRHMISHDESAVLRKFKCPECEKAFKFKHHLKVYIIMTLYTHLLSLLLCYDNIWLKYTTCTYGIYWDVILMRQAYADPCKHI